MVIIFNGPPGSGKDAGCEYLERVGFKHLSFKHELYKTVCDHFDVDHNWFMEGYHDRYIKEHRKEPKLGNRTRREAMIHVAEDIIKPKFGKNYYGEQVASQINPDNDYCISDAGYIEEVQSIIDHVGEENVTVIQVSRNGHSFGVDKRRYIGKDVDVCMTFPLKEEARKDKTTPTEYDQYSLDTNFKVKTFRICNNSTLEYFNYYVDYVLFILTNGEE